MRDLDIEALQRCLLSSSNPSSVRSITFADLDDEDLADFIVTLISKLACLESISVEGTDPDAPCVDCNPILDALRWPESLSLNT